MLLTISGLKNTTNITGTTIYCKTCTCENQQLEPIMKSQNYTRSLRGDEAHGLLFPK